MNHREDYLRAIYDLTKSGKNKTKTSEISKELDVSDASASETIQKLEDQDLVCRAAYKGFTLSPMGKNQGEKAKDKFEALVEIFDELGVNNPEGESDSVEHSISEEAVKKLEEEVLEN